MAEDQVYLDNAATTALDPRVCEAMQPFFGARFGNPSSLHRAGRQARVAVDSARDEVAALIGASPREIVFVASGTEADNLALFGAVGARGGRARHVVTSAVEHPAILETCHELERRGVEVSYAAATPDGIITPAALAAVLRTDTFLVSVMTANNVVGTVQPIAELARLAHAQGALFHTDAVQAAGKMPLDVAKLEVDLLSLSAHKIHGPQGVGALYVRGGTSVAPMVFGGGQERGLRSATENVAGIVGFGAAARLARTDMTQEAVRLVALRDRIFDTVATKLKGSYVLGDRFRRLPGHVAIAFSGLEAEAVHLLLALDERGIAVSSGSACSAHHRGEPSHVLRAMGFDVIRARGALRVTLGRFTTEADVDRFLEVLPETVATLRPVVTHACL